MLSSPTVVVTTHAHGRDNGLVARSAIFASLVPEAPRVLVELTKANLTHDLVLASQAFVLHTLPATPHAALMKSLSLVHALGMRSGHDGDKMTGIATRPGVTGCPILMETLTYLEARVFATRFRRKLPRASPAPWSLSCSRRRDRVPRAPLETSAPGTWCGRERVLPSGHRGHKRARARALPRGRAERPPVLRGAHVARARFGPACRLWMGGRLCRGACRGTPGRAARDRTGRT